MRNRKSIFGIVLICGIFCVNKPVIAGEQQLLTTVASAKTITTTVTVTKPLPATKPVVSGEKHGCEPVAGEWLRVDGNYTFKLTNVKADGHAKIEYFNPKPIYVSKSEVSMWKGLIKLEVEFQDKGYEGSKYRLYYYAEKDALAGYYYQASGNKTYRVIFLRKQK